MAYQLHWQHRSLAVAQYKRMWQPKAAAQRPMLASPYRWPLLCYDNNCIPSGKRQASTVV